VKETQPPQSQPRQNDLLSRINNLLRIVGILALQYHSAIFFAGKINKKLKVEIKCQ